MGRFWKVVSIRAASGWPKLARSGFSGYIIAVPKTLPKNPSQDRPLLLRRHGSGAFAPTRVPPFELVLGTDVADGAGRRRCRAGTARTGEALPASLITCRDPVNVPATRAAEGSSHYQIVANARKRTRTDNGNIDAHSPTSS